MRRLFKRTIVCLIAVMMIVSSLPFSAISVQAGTSSLSLQYSGILINSTSASNRYSKNSSTNVATLTVVNDMQASNSDVGYAGFDISSFSVGDDEIVEAEYSFDELIENSGGEREDCGLTVYYPTKNVSDFLKNFSSSNCSFSSGSGLKTHTSSSDSNYDSTTFISTVKSYYGLVELSSYDSIIEQSKNTTVTQTLDIGPAIKAAKAAGLSTATICFMLSQAGGQAATASSSTTHFSGSSFWSDTKVVLNNLSVSATTKAATPDYYKNQINVSNASVKVPSETYVNTASDNTDFMKGVVYTSGWTSNGITKLASNSNSALYFQFGMNGLSNAVAIYTGDNDIRFPVIAFNRANGSSNHTYIHYISLSSSSFALGLDWYRCSGEQDLTSSTDPQAFSKETGGTHLTNNYFTTNDTKQWRNYIKYTGSGDTTNYYEKLPTTFNFCAQYGYNPKSSGSGYYENDKTITLNHSMYVLNMKPYKNIVDSLSTDYNNVNSLAWKYTDESLINYYKAVLDIINFDISNYVSSISSESDVQTAANAIKTVVNNYNSAKNNLNYKTLNVTFHRLNGEDVTVSVIAGNALGSLPTNSTAKHIENTKTHYTYAWDSSVTTSTIPQADVTYNEVATVSDCTIQAGGTCSICGGQLLDLSAYNTAYNEAATTITTHITGTRIYTDDSISEYKTIVKNANDSISSVTTQAEVDNLTATIIAAKSVLRKNSCTVNFVLYSDDSTSPEDTETYSKEYGSVFNLNLNEITKDTVKAIIVKTDDGKTQTKVYPSGSTFTLYVTKDVEVEVYVTSSPSETTTEYSKVTFLGKNGNIVNVKYVEKAATLDTSDITAPEIPFYNFSGWDKASVTGTGSDIYVRASYSYKATDADKCNIHFVENGEITWEKAYTYDSYVYLNGADKSKMYALASDKAGTKILTYLDGIEFYAPKTADIYVVEVESKSAKIAITGNFKEELTESSVEKVAASFNCKFYLPEGCTPIEWGAYISSGTTTKTVKAESISGGNEYTIRMKIKKTLVTGGSVTSFTGKAYLIYKDSNGTTHTIVSDPVEQSLT